MSFELPLFKQRFVFKLEFLGTFFCGSQAQPNARTVQDEFEKALKIYLKPLVRDFSLIKDLRVVMASRVDAGVHAKEMIGHFDLMIDSSFELNETHTCKCLNGILPSDLAIKRLARIQEGFHSIKQATSRSYIYQLRTGGTKSPLDQSQTSYVYYSKPLDAKQLNAECQILIGSHDFSGLSNKKEGYRNPICKVMSCSWTVSARDSELLIFRIQADHFIYNMIRIIVGTQIVMGNGKISSYSLEKALRLKDRTLAGPTAPASGLCLEEIHYPFTLFT